MQNTNTKPLIPLSIISEEKSVDLNEIVRCEGTETLMITIEGSTNIDEIDDGDHVVVALGERPQSGNIVLTNEGDAWGFQYYTHSGLRLVTAEAVPTPVCGVVTWVLKRQGGSAR